MQEAALLCTPLSSSAAACLHAQRMGQGTTFHRTFHTTHLRHRKPLSLIDIVIWLQWLVWVLGHSRHVHNCIVIH